MKVVHEWSLQRDFLEICKLTEAQEGSIVKTIQRLEILLRDVRNAARIMGNMILFKKLIKVEDKICFRIGKTK